VFLIILALLLNQPIVTMPHRTVTIDGITGRQPIVQPGVVNWWSASAQPGQGDNIVLYGHSTDVFSELHRIQPGAIITLTWASPSTCSGCSRDYGYVVKRAFVVSEGSASERAENGKLIGSTGREQLTLVTCYADKSRLIVIAE
jgi:sortase (surface protein transpeptidase)